MIHIGKYFGYFFHGGAKIPTFLFKINKYNKNKEEYSLETRYNYTRLKIDDVLNNIIRIKLEIHGLENLSKNENYLICPNHQSMLDPVCMIHLLEKPCLMVSKKEVKKMPVVGKIVNMIDGFFLDRESPRDALKMLKTCRKALIDGLNVVIFPEGTRSKDTYHTLGEYKPGAFKCVYNTNKKILPVVIDKSYIPLSVKHKNANRVVKISFLKPITPSEYEKINTTELANLIENMAKKELINLRK